MELFQERVIMIQCLYPQWLGSKFKPFQIQYCMFIKVNLLFSSSTGLFDFSCRLTVSTSGGGGGGEVGMVRPKSQELQKQAARPHWVSERHHPQKQSGQLPRVLLCLPVCKKEKRWTIIVILSRPRILYGLNHLNQFFSKQKHDLSF